MDLARVEIVWGYMGSGKTSYGAYAALQTYKLNKGRCNIVGNLDLALPNYKKVDINKLLDMMDENHPTPDYLWDGIGVWDEAHHMANSRTPGAKANRLFNEFITYSRKRSFANVLITQKPGRLDKICRESATRELHMVDFDRENQIAEARITYVNPPIGEVTVFYNMREAQTIFDTRQQVNSGSKMQNAAKIRGTL